MDNQEQHRLAVVKDLGLASILMPFAIALIVFAQDGGLSSVLAMFALIASAGFTYLSAMLENSYALVLALLMWAVGIAFVAVAVI